MIDTQAIRNKILDLAMRGKLTEQLPEDGTAEELYQSIQKDWHTTTENTISKDNDYEFDLPQSWIWVQLSSIVTKPIKRGKSPRYSETGETLVFAQKCNTKAGIIDLQKALKLDESTLSKYMPDDFMQNGDIVINSTGTGTLGRVGIYRIDDNPGKLPLVPDSHVTTIRIAPKLDCTYIFWCLKSLQPQLEGMGTGSTNQKELSASSLSTISIPLPPLAEQHRIVEKIEQAFSALDTIDALQAKYADNLTVLKSKLIDAAIQGKLTEQLPEDGTAEELYQQIQAKKQALIKAGKIKKEKPLPEISAEEIPFEIPKSWKWVALGNIASKISSGSTPTGGSKADVYVSSGFPFFREQNIYDDGIHRVGMVFISEKLLQTRPNSTVNSKDILLNITGGSIGRCALVPDDFDKGSINQHILIIRTVEPETRFYVHMLIRSSYVQSYIKNKAVGDKDGFSGGRCKRMLVPLPPLAEQKRIVERITKLLAVCDELKANSKP